MTDITIIRGDDRTLNITITEDGSVLDITGYTLFFTVKSCLTDIDTAALISKDVTTHTNPTLGVTQVVLTNTDTDLTPDTYFYDMQLKTDTGSIISTGVGEFNIVYDVTRRTS